MLFWQFANDIVPVAQAKRFYPLFGQMSSLAPVVAGLCVVRFTNGVSMGGKGEGEGEVATQGEGVPDFMLVRKEDAAACSCPPCPWVCGLLSTCLALVLACLGLAAVLVECLFCGLLQSGVHERRVVL